MSTPESIEFSNSAFNKSHCLASHDLASHNAIGDFGPDSSLGFSVPNYRSGYYMRTGSKRFFDITTAIFALLLFLPLFIFVGTAILLADGRPIYFSHKRVGRGGKCFNCIKFRTMANDAEERLRLLLETDSTSRSEWAEMHKLRNDPRVNSVGLLLRKASLDELPQLFNVLKGDMSLVGPRPIVEEEVVRYKQHFAIVASVRPGITGLWQVCGRSGTSYDRRVALDVEYVQTMSFYQDIRILLRTVWVVLAGRGSF
jgi:exopolysaccharide production protein ExoY